MVVVELDSLGLVKLWVCGRPINKKKEIYMI